MSKTQVTTARKIAATAVAAIMASALSFPSMALALDSGTVDGQSIANGTAVAETAGTGGGTWAYDGADTISLNNFVGEAIYTIGDTIIQLEGDNTVNGDIDTTGSLTINGDSEKYGADKPSLTMDASKAEKEYAEQAKAEGWEYTTESEIYASHGSQDKVVKGNLTIRDVNLTFNADEGYIDSHGGDLSIINSKVSGGDANDYLGIYSSNCFGVYSDTGDMLLKGSVIDANHVGADGTLTIDNTDLTVTPYKDVTEFTEDGWITTAVQAGKDIVLVGENQPYEKKEYTDEDGDKWFYLYTGALDKVELKATETPAYYGPAKAMPKTGDNTMAIVFGAGAAVVLSAAAAAFALRKRNEER